MSGLIALLKIGGYVALLLWGTHMVTSGVLRAFGGQLRQRVGVALGSFPRAFIAGVSVTLALQSSTATGLMAASFAAHGLLAAAPGYVLMLGANVGTALVTQIFSFPVAWLAPVLFLMGFILFRHNDQIRSRNLGRVLIGLGLMLLSLHELVQAFSPIAQVPAVQGILEALGQQTPLAFLIGLVAAWLCHSSVAVVLLVLSLASAGTLPVAAGLAMVFGANLGGALSPALEAQGAVAKRLPMGNLLVRGVGVAIAMAFLPTVVWILAQLGHTGARSIVDAHVAFNVLLALAALPFARPVSTLLVRLLPDPPVPEDPGHPRYLDASLVGEPHLALANVEREALRLSDLVADQLREAGEALVKTSQDAAERVGALGDAATTLGRAIRHHLAAMSAGESMNDDESRRSQELLAFAMNLEHAADILPHHLVEPAMREMRQGIPLSAAEQAAIQDCIGELIESMGLAVAALLRRDLKAAQTLIARKTAMRDRETQWIAAAQHKTVGVAWSRARGSAVEVDAILRAFRECRRVHGHLAAVAYHLLEQAGRLQSRVTDADPGSP